MSSARALMSVSGKEVPGSSFVVAGFMIPSKNAGSAGRPAASVVELLPATKLAGFCRRMHAESRHRVLEPSAGAGGSTFRQHAPAGRAGRLKEHANFDRVARRAMRGRIRMILCCGEALID